MANEFKVKNGLIVNGNTQLSGSVNVETSLTVPTLTVSNGFSGSFSGSFQGDGSSLTGISSVGGADTQVQFNDGGSIAGDADFTWNKTSNTLTLPAGTISASFVSASTYYGDGSNLTGLTVETANTASYVEDYNINTNIVTLSVASNVLTWDVTGSLSATVTLDQNITTFNLNSAKSGQSGVIIMTQDGTGGRSTVLPASSKVVNNGIGVISLTSDANSIDVLSWFYDGSTFYWNAGYYYS